MADAAVSAVLFAAKIAIRVAMLVQQNKANLKYADDLLARVNSINHVLGMLSKLPPEMLADLSSVRAVPTHAAAAARLNGHVPAAA